MPGYTEDQLIEQPAIQLMEHELGWNSVNAYDEWAGGASSLGRESKREVVLVSRLRPVLEKLNPELPAEALDAAVEELTRDRSALSLVEGNREIDKLLRGGVKVTIPDRERGGQRVDVVRVVDWDDAAANDFLLVSQFWITGDLYTKRPDLIGFVNGLPQVLIELKKPGVNVREAFDKNLADYKETIPQLFHYNGFLLVSNGVQSKIGSLTAEWEHFGDWKKVAEEEETPDISLNTLLRGTCEKSRLLDLVENFTRFSESKGAVGKLVARNHQFLGVNRAVEALKTTEDGRVGVFWHTQGSGKSYSMVFFAEKVFRKLAGNWTFVVITDRTELDTQIYRTFSTCGAASELCQATSASHLRKLLSEDHRYVFTLIHKFRTDPGTLHPVLSERDDIIVLTDEAHRSQYDTLAMNMRTALPNAKFVAFTGTPLIAGEERTREVFGDYVSIYDFKQSVEDGATVPLFYENRTPELEITNPELNDEIYEVIDDAGLDDDQEEKLKKVLGKRYHLITREERLDAVAKDIVHHFLNRGYQGKAMVVSIDKLTTLRMFEKVRAEWEAEKVRVLAELEGMSPQRPEYPVLNERLRNLQETDMAVVVSPGQNEISEMKDKGFDILPHRERMVKEDLETKFKDPEDPFRLVFVCAMWLTGFDAPSCSTLYLDKPMRGHTLMQTIARANRVYGDKVHGLIVDYANVFAELEKALAIYGSSKSGGEMPVKDKTELIEALRVALEQVKEFCRKQNVDLEAAAADPVKHFVAAVNQLKRTDPVKDEFLGHARDVQRLYKAVMPDPIIPTLAPTAQVIAELAKAVRADADPVDITAVLEDIGKKLDGAIIAEPHVEPGEKAKTVDLSQVDFGVLEKKFAKSQTKNLEAQQLRALIERKLDNMIRLNASRYDFLDRFQKMIEEYNNGAMSIEQLFEELVSLSKDLNDEEQRHVRESVSEEQLAIFDILTRPGPDLDPKEVESIKKVCKELLGKLKTELLVLAWRNKRTTRAAVRVEIEKMLDAGLPEKYTAELFEQKCGVLFQHVLEKYPDEGASVYGEVG
ncbi:type I restriction endonuclease subunit R [Haloferula sp.]|uniref:type I restriction endonuclease subunit R n=1 Tax=Haloferula sp. TaxID=2497595 RepID=UPI00329BEEEA